MSKHNLSTVAAIFVGLLLTACAGAFAADDAQPILPRSELVIDTAKGPVQFTVELASTPRQQERGLMFRTHLAPDEGMLFDFVHDGMRGFWMKNTLIPLDMVFIAGDGTIRSIAENTVPRSLATIDARFPVRATLELAAGATARLNIRVGDKVENRIFTPAK